MIISQSNLCYYLLMISLDKHTPYRNSSNHIHSSFVKKKINLALNAVLKVNQYHNWAFNSTIYWITETES